MLHKIIDDLTVSDILRLIDNQVPEGKTLDYKEALTLGNKDAKRTLCEHASSLANAAGGWLLYGIREAVDPDGGRLGYPDEVVGIKPGMTDDELLRAVDDVLRNGVVPRLETRTRVLGGFEGDRKVLAVHVPQSFRGPHMVHSGRAKFFARSNAGKESMDIDQLRVAFGAGTSLLEKVREFRFERVGRIVAGDVPVGLHYDMGRVVLHLVPLSGFSVSLVASEIPLRARESRRLLPLYSEADGYSHRFNLDGFCFHDGVREEEGATGYVQVFRQGMIEAVDAIMLHRRHANGHGKLLVDEIEPRVVDSLNRYAKLMVEDLGIRGPVAVMMSLVDVEGYMFDVEEYRLRQHHPIDRAQVLLPEVLVDDIEDIDTASMLKPIFDAMWQAAGAPRSANFDDGGRWKRPSR